MGRKAKSPRVLNLRKKRMKKIKGTFREVGPVKKIKRTPKKTLTKKPRKPPTKAKAPKKSGWLKKQRIKAKTWVTKHD